MRTRLGSYIVRIDAPQAPSRLVWRRQHFCCCWAPHIVTWTAPFNEHRPPNGITGSAVTVISGNEWLKPILIPVVRFYLTGALVLEQPADSQALLGTFLGFVPSSGCKGGWESVCLALLISIAEVACVVNRESSVTDVGSGVD